MSYEVPSSVVQVWLSACSCCEHFRPCGGVMAGGMCDKMDDGCADGHEPWYGDERDEDGEP